MKKSFSRAIVSVFVASELIVSSVFSVVPIFAAPSNVGVIAGNNGTLKVHEIGTPSGTENNDPKVCKFNLESFGLDKAQTGYLAFDVQGQDAPNGTATSTQYAFGPANADGYAVSQDFNNGGAKIADGHYKVTLYGKDTSKKGVNLDEVKAKSKVFKVECSVTTTPTTPATPTVPTTPVVPDDKPSAPNQPGIANNGTLKVHEIGTPVKINDNDPKVCAFDIEGFKFDKGQTGYLKLSVQGKDAPVGVAPEAVYTFGPTDVDGYAISATKFNTKNGVAVADGHYKVTLYGKADLQDEKAKSKVFKVTCEAEQETPATPTTPVNPGTPGGNVLGDTTTNTTPVTTGTKVSVLSDTGTSMITVTLLAVLFAVAASIAYKRPLDNGQMTQEQINMLAL